MSDANLSHEQTLRSNKRNQSISSTLTSTPLSPKFLESKQVGIINAFRGEQKAKVEEGHQTSATCEGVDALFRSLSDDLQLHQQVPPCEAHLQRQELESGRSSISNESESRELQQKTRKEALTDRGKPFLQEAHDASDFAVLQMVCNARVEEATEFLRHVPQKALLKSFENGRTLLMFAVLRSRCEILDLILQRTPEILDLKDDEGKSALHYSVRYSKEISTHWLMKKGANISAKDCDHSTPLHVAAKNQNIELMLSLIAKGADLLCKDRFGLSAASYVKDQSVIRSLLALTSPPRKQSNDSQRATEDHQVQFRTVVEDKAAFDSRARYFARLRIKQEQNFQDSKPASLDSKFQEITSSRIAAPAMETMLHAASDEDEQKEVPKFQLKLHPCHLEAKDFVVEDVLGKGSFGEILLGKLVETGEMLALKEYSKRHMLSSRLVKYLLLEKQILSSVNSPFIPKLKACFQTERKLYLALEYCEKGDLGRYLERNGRMTVDQARILIAELILAIEELHRHNFMHRDIKPENVLISADGHIKLSDFGLCKHLLSGKDRATTVCGTQIYLPPEVLQKQKRGRVETDMDFQVLHCAEQEEASEAGYWKSADWYLVGELLFELVFGKPPFFDRCRRRMEENILHAKLRFPEDCSVPSNFKDLVASLLLRDPSARLGSLHGAEELKAHPFFLGIDWGKIFRKEVQLFVPSVLPSFRSRRRGQTIRTAACEPNSDFFELVNWSFVSPHSPPAEVGETCKAQRKNISHK